MLLLIDYDRNRGQIVELRTFDDSQRHDANEARLELGLRLNRTGIEREVGILEAASEAAVRKTHRRYFEDLESLATLPDRRSSV